MADVKPWKVATAGGGLGELREFADGDGEWWVVAPYCTAGGTANALTLTLQHGLGKPSAYRAGQQFRFRAAVANTGAATINVAGLGAKTAVTVTGAALPAGYIRTDVDTTITYDAVGDRFVVGREIERGSNANGSFTRWADGTQLCRAALVYNSAINLAITGGFRSPATTWVHPASFAAAAVVIATSAGLSPFYVPSVYLPGAGSSGLVMTSATSIATADLPFNITAAGVWYT